ncbi:type VI secretion system TssO [Xanthovirga aplysinae]|uniref:type VI secretion system TssO n=1 Tax=Xanthovirga aplysinae TaxID=2529853 RepID=UPI0012BD0249|nr:type VI secretion system TssO [Xanthovirga aplysinae]MTI31960.1 hypothetical protein [Xanthovirga aplysinae]
MEVLNKKERIRAFLLFLLLFVVTIAMIVFTIFFDFQLPWQQNQLLKTENDQISVEFDFQQAYKQKMFKAKDLLDSMNLPGQNSYYMEQLVGSELIEMQKSIPEDSLLHDDMYDHIITLYTDMLEDKKTLRDLKDAELTISELKQNLEVYKIELESARSDLEVLEKLNRAK